MTKFTFSFGTCCLLLALYLVKSLRFCSGTGQTFKHISSSVDRINLNWLMQFLMLLAMVIFIWINDAFFNCPVVRCTTWLYTIAFFFWPIFSIKQGNHFRVPGKDIPEISAIIGQSGEDPLFGYRGQQAFR